MYLLRRWPRRKALAHHLTSFERRHCVASRGGKPRNAQKPQPTSDCATHASYTGRYPHVTRSIYPVNRRLLNKWVPGRCMGEKQARGGQVEENGKT